MKHIHVLGFSVLNPKLTQDTQFLHCTGCVPIVNDFSKMFLVKEYTRGSSLNNIVRIYF